MQRRIWSAVAAVVVGTGAPALAQLVNNPGFESVVLQNTDGLQGNWGTFYGGVPPVTLVAVEDPSQFHSGVQSFHLRVADNLNAYCGAAQRVGPVSGNIAYDFKFWGKKGADTNPNGTMGHNGFDVKIEWKNALGFNTGTVQVFHPELTDEWLQFSYTATAPADAVAATLVFAAQSFEFLNPATAGAEGYFDDVEFVVSGTSVGACCGAGTGQCVITSNTICQGLGGSFRGPASTCDTPCPAACSADFDHNSTVSVNDLFAFLSAWFAQNGVCP